MNKGRIDQYFDDPAVRARLIGAISRLVAVKSVKGPAEPGAPFGPGPKAALDEALALASELGFSVQNYDDHVGLVDLNGGPTQLHILAHLDVVGEGAGWDTDPYTCVEKDGMLYGRGVSDDKGPLCAALMAMVAVRDLGGVAKNAKLVMGTDEESGSEDISYYYAREPFAPYSFTPDADFPVIHIEKGHYFPDFGAAWAEETAIPRVTSLQGGFRHNVVPPEAQCTILGLSAADVETVCAQVSAATGAVLTAQNTDGGAVVHCAGKNAHAASPDDGINAIQALLEALALLPLADCHSTDYLRSLHTLFPFGDNRGKGLGIAQSDEESGELTLNLACITMTPTRFKAKFDVRFPLCANQFNCKGVCEETFRRHGISILGDPDMTTVHCVSADSPLVKTLLRCYSMYTGVQDPKPIAIGGGTYVHNIPGGVAFGCDFPGFDPKMHAANEQASVDDLLLSAKIFTQAIFDLCGE